jgi:hypothetical protein
VAGKILEGKKDIPDDAKAVLREAVKAVKAQLTA